MDPTPSGDKGDDVSSGSDNERQQREDWINALSDAVVDFKGLLCSTDLRHFSDILTDLEMEQCRSQSNTDSLSVEIIKCFREKPLHLLKKIPECLRAANNVFLAEELERAYQRQVIKSKPRVSGTLRQVQKASAPVEAQEKGHKGELVVAGGLYGSYQREDSTSQPLPAFDKSDSIQAEQCAEAKHQLVLCESKIATLKAGHDECTFELKRHFDAVEEYKENPTKFLEQLIPMELSDTDALAILEQAFPYISQSATSTEAFHQLLYYSCFNHCLNPELLMRIAEILGVSERVKKQKGDVDKFCSSLAVETYIHMREYNFPPVSMDALAEIVLKLSRNWQSCKIKEILDVVQGFCHIAKVPPFLCRLWHIRRARESIVLTVLVPRQLTVAVDVRLTKQDSQSKLEEMDFVEVTISGKELFSVKDTRINNFVKEEIEECLPSAYKTPEQDCTAKMYKILRLCQKHYDKMLGFSQSVPQHFWKFLAHWCLTFMNGSICEASSANHEEQIAACFKDSKLNVSDNCLDRHVRAGKGDQIALVYEPMKGEIVKVTYKKLLEKTCRIANIMKKDGVRKGECVVIYMPSCPQAVACMLACARIGVRHCAIPSSSSVYILKQRLLDTNAVALMTVNSDNKKSRQREMFEVVRAVLKQQSFEHLKEVYYSNGREECVIKEKPPQVNLHHIETEVEQVDGSCDPEPMKGNDPLFIMYTSGTTGGPKGLEHTQAGYLLYAMVTYQVSCFYEPGDVMAFFTDPGWIISHCFAVHGALSSGSTSFLYDGSLRDKNIGWLWNLVKKHEITQLMTTPSMLASLKNQSHGTNIETKPECLKFISSVGERLPQLTRNWYKEKLQCKICDNYGQTEAGSSIMCNRVWRNDEGKIEVQESSLQPFFGVQPMLVNPKTKKEEKGCTVSGTLFLRYPLPGFAITIAGDHDRYRRMYWKEVDEHPHIFATFDQAYRKADGGYKITGRTDDIIAIGEQRYDPYNLEKTLEDVGIVKQAAAVMRPSIGRETAVMFFVVLEDAATSTGNFIKTEKYLKERLAKMYGALSQKLVSILFVKELPTTQSAKTSRHYLREIAAGRGILKMTDLESLHKSSVPLDIGILFSLYAEGGEVVAHESANYRSVYQTSLDYQEVFWSSLAKRLLKWRTDKFETINSCDFSRGHVEWFKGGTLNASESCLDQHTHKTKSPALIHFQTDRPEIAISYTELKEMTCQIANLMIEAQLKYKETAKPPMVMICMPLTPLAVASMLACARIGAAHYNLSMDNLSIDKFWEKFDAVLPSAIVTVHSMKEHVTHVLNMLPSQHSVTVFLADVPFETNLSHLEYKMVDLKKEMNSQAKDVEAVAVDSNHPLLATFSSMDPANLVFHSHAGFLLHSATSHKYVLGHQSDDRLAVTNDPSSMVSLTYSVYGLLCNGGTAVLFDSSLQSFSPGWCWEMLKRARVTQFLTTQDIVKEMRNSNPREIGFLSLRVFGTSGERLSKEDWYWLKEGVGNGNWTMIDHYGVPEIGGCLIAPRPYFKQTHTEQVPGSPMVPFFGVNLGIFDSNGEEITKPGVKGALFIKSAVPGMAISIYKDFANKSVMRNIYFTTRPGYFETGDYATKDEHGNYCILGKQQ